MFLHNQLFECFVLTRVPCLCLGSLSEEGLLLYLNALQTLLPLLPVTESTSRADINSDSEDEEEMNIQHHATRVHIHTLP